MKYAVNDLSAKANLHSKLSERSERPEPKDSARAESDFAQQS